MISERSAHAAAVFTIHDASSMTPKERRELATWLRDHADMLVRDGKNYSKRFTGRYMYRTKERP